MSDNGSMMIRSNAEGFTSELAQIHMNDLKRSQQAYGKTVKGQHYNNGDEAELGQISLSNTFDRTKEDYSSQSPGMRTSSKAQLTR